MDERRKSGSMNKTYQPLKMMLTLAAQYILQEKKIYLMAR
ncbi:hypothetical protein yinte0001_26880 [Yersinia intermedia ATCC 29909]|nr:hypothetical protein yinte0001_26880 [Yersinia intermedia ATCC 29909]